MQKLPWLDVLRRDLKFTRRVLTKNPSFTATAIVTLALGIFGVVDGRLSGIETEEP